MAPLAIVAIVYALVFVLFFGYDGTTKFISRWAAALLQLAAQTVRMLREEAVLKAGTRDADYTACCTAVRWRSVPFVF